MAASDTDALPSLQNQERSILLSLKSISKTYVTGDVSVPVLHNVDLEVFSGEFLVIVGPSGSAKALC